jgi:hypothetical protein
VIINCPRAVHARTNQFVVTPFILRKSARTVLPFYKKIARNEIYAKRWSTAVRNAELSDMIRLIKQAIPGFNNDFGLSVNGIAYFIDVQVPEPVEIYTNGTGIPPGMVQFHFNTKAHRSIAIAIQPLYRAIINSQPFAKAIVEAIRRKDIRILNQVIRSKVKSPYLRKVDFDTFGFMMRFKFPFEKYPYDNSFFLNVPL